MPIFYDIFWRAIYQLPTPLFQQASTIIDLGAHIGMAAAWFNIHAPQATLYCIEADEANYEILVKNLRPGIDTGRVIAIHAAINNTNDLVYLQRSARSYNSQLSTAITNFPVKGIRMQQLLHDYHITHIDILKIDIEGAESLLFNDDVSWLKITSAIIIEIHSEENLRQFTAAVTPYGFRIEKKYFENEDLYYAFNPAYASAISST
jgi:FkbM family methyltransferase